jgi:hypothetical protein
MSSLTVVPAFYDFDVASFQDVRAREEHGHDDST